MSATADAEFDLLCFGIGSHEASRALEEARRMRPDFDRLNPNEQKRVFREAWSRSHD